MWMFLKPSNSNLKKCSRSFGSENQTDKNSLEKFLTGRANIVHRNVAPVA